MKPSKKTTNRAETKDTESPLSDKRPEAVDERLANAAQNFALWPRNAQGQETEEEYAQRIAATESIMLIQVGNLAGTKRKRYKVSDIEALLHIGHASIKQLFEAAAIPFPQMPEDFNEVQNALTLLFEKGSKLEQDNIYGLALSLESTHSLRANPDMTSRPTIRVCSIVTNRVARADIETVPQEFRTLTTFEKFSNIVSVPPEVWVLAAEYFNVSLHWIMGLSDDMPVYTDNPQVDHILDIYSFMPRPCQEAFHHILIDYPAEWNSGHRSAN